MKKALKYILILLLCAAIGLGVSAAIRSGIQRAEIENTYIASYPQAIELPKKQGKEILKGNYSARNRMGLLRERRFEGFKFTLAISRRTVFMAKCGCADSK